MIRRTWFHPLMLCMVLLMSGSLMAQAQGGGAGGGFGGNGGGGGRGGRGGRGGIENQLAFIQEQLGATAEEWAVLQPKVQAVLMAQQEANSGRGRGGRGGRGRGGDQGGGGFNQQPESALARAMAALRDALNNSGSSNELIKQRLQQVRDARARADQALKAAQDTLTQLLTPKQEAVMVSLGYLP